MPVVGTAKIILDAGHLDLKSEMSIGGGYQFLSGELFHRLKNKIKVAFAGYIASLLPH